MKAQKPPNLRETKSCNNCSYFNGSDLCKMYDYPVDEDDLCDSWAAGAEEHSEEDQKKRLWAAHRRRLERNR